MSATFIITGPDGVTMRIHELVARHMGLQPCQRVTMAEFAQVLRSTRALERACGVMANAHKRVNPTPGTVCIEADKNCQVCGGEAFTTNTFTGRVDACPHCVAPYGWAYPLGPNQPRV